MISVAPPRAASAAVISSDRQYRYRLTRCWQYGRFLCWVMLNPSMADARVDDPTVKRCIFFTRLWGYGGLQIVNLFALRSSDPKRLLAVEDPIGPDWHEHFEAALNSSVHVIAAWGNGVPPVGVLHAHRVSKRLWAADARCLGKTQSGAPLHPLARGKHRVPDDVKLMRF